MQILVTPQLQIRQELSPISHKFIKINCLSLKTEHCQHKEGYLKSKGMIQRVNRH
jgi:hypothetical protein